MIMRKLRIRELPAATDKLGNTFIIALIVLALLWGYQLRQRVDERDYLIRTVAFEASGETEIGKVAVAYRGGPGCLNSLSASISGASAGVRLPCGLAAG